MGVLTMVARLALRDLRRRRTEAVLLLFALAATTTTLTLGLAVRGSAAEPWDRTRAATAGPDAVATAARADDLDTLAGDPGVTGTAGPYPTLRVEDLRVRDIRLAAVIQGRDAAPGPIDRPLVTDGSWVRRGGAVVERAFADALKVRPGDRFTLAGRSFRVAGIAVTAARAPYPSATPGLIWLTKAEVTSLGRPVTGVVMPLRLADPAAAPAFAAAHRGVVRSWQETGLYATAELRRADQALLAGAWALALLSTACVAVLVGGRLADQTRRVGLLKAIGATPRMVAATLLAEHLALALAATVLGLAAGWAAAPLLARPSLGLLGMARPGIGPGVATLVAAIAVAVTGAATGVPAVRGARMSTLRALAGPARAPRRFRWLIGLSARLPASLLLGLRLAARRPRRTLLATASLALTAAMVVAAIAMRGDLVRRDARTAGIDFVPGAGNPVSTAINHAVVAGMIALLVLAAVNAVLIAWATALDAQRSTALARALGATPAQVTLGLSAAQAIPATVAGTLGIPLGVLIYRAARVMGGVPGPGSVSYAWSLAVIPGTLVVVALLTAVPVRAGARRPVVGVLRAE